MYLKISIGIRAHNEEANIGNLLNHLLKQETEEDVEVEEIIVVASGCTDRTVDIVKEYQRKSDLIRLFTEEERKGPASALNIILGGVRGDILVIVNADTFPSRKSILNLVKPFKDKSVGATVGRAIPVNNPDTAWGYIAHLIYKWLYLPDFLMIDFESLTAISRDLICSLKVPDVFCDEHYVDSIVRQNGYKIVHVPDAVNYTKQPDNLFDFIHQRRKYFFSHLQMQKLNIYTPHVDSRKVIPTVLRSLNPKNPKKLFWLFSTLFLSAFCYISAWNDFMKGESYRSYKDTISSKMLITANGE